MDNRVFVSPCGDYVMPDMERALREVLAGVGIEDIIKPGMRVGVKVNLVSAMKPARAATTHPLLAAQLCRILARLGAQVVVGDSPGGLYNQAYVGGVYSLCGMHEVEKAGARLNHNFDTAQADYPQAAYAKTFMYTSWLDECDCIINFCKLKTHGMMGMSAAVKNMFGAVPGTFKPEYHYVYPDAYEFAGMLVDLNEYFKPVISIADAVVGMEGNGPTAGSPRRIGALLASRSPYALDAVCAELIGLHVSDVPTLSYAADKSLGPADISQVQLEGSLDKFIVADFKKIDRQDGLGFLRGTGFAGKVVSKALSSRPVLEASKCIGCRKCEQICPAKAISMRRGRPSIDRGACIRCFCCQEFCPKGAMVVRRPLVARVLNRK